MEKNIQKKLTLLTFALIITITAMGAVSAATGDEVTNAIATPSTLNLMNSNTTQGGDDQFVVSDTPAQGFPTNGSSYANINTGNANGESYAKLSLNLTIPKGAQTLTFDWRFASDDYPYFADWARAEIVDGSSTQNILFLPNRNTVDVVNAWSYLSPTTPNDIGYAQITPMYTTTTDISPYAGRSILLNFSVADSLDTVVTTALFIDNLHIGPVTDLSLTKTVDNTKPVVGNTIKYLLTVNNKGPDTANGVTVTELLSKKLQFVSAIPSKGTYNPTTGIWTIGTLANGESATLTINAIVKAAGPIINQANAIDLAYDPDLSNNQVEQTIEAQAAETVETANAANTIGMQETGAPFGALIVAVLMMFGGMVLPRRK